MRPLIAALGVAVFALVAALATRGAPATSDVAAAAVPLATADPSDASRTSAARDRGRDPDERADRRYVIHGLVLPFADAALPDDVELLPNAARDYRGGTHEGVDFAAAPGTDVRAVAVGIVVRVDQEFTDWTAEERTAALDEAVTLGHTPAATLDRIRGRQVWIDHGHGVVTRYAHLAAVAAGLAVGDTVVAGQVIGAVGSSGYPEGGPHLHLEIWRSNRFLGEGLAGDALREAVLAAFS